MRPGSRDSSVDRVEGNCECEKCDGERRARVRGVTTALPVRHDLLVSVAVAQSHLLSSHPSASRAPCLCSSCRHHASDRPALAWPSSARRRREPSAQGRQESREEASAAANWRARVACRTNLVGLPWVRSCQTSLTVTAAKIRNLKLRMQNLR